MENKDSEVTRASPEATTLRIVTGPTLRAPELEMIGQTEAALAPAPEAAPASEAIPVQSSPEAEPAIEAPPAPPFAPLLDTPEQQAAYWQSIAQAAHQPEQGVPALNTAGAGLLFATSTGGTTLFISKEAMILLVVLVAGVIVVSVLCVYGRAGGTGAPASA